MAAGVTFRVDSHELEELARRADDVARRKMGQLLQREVVAMGITVKAEVVKRTPHGATGSLSESIDSSKVAQRSTRGYEAEVFSEGVMYAEPVEVGRKPGKMPPYRALIRWVELRLGIRGKEAPRVAYLIARKIGKKGTHGARMFHYGLNAAKKQLNEIHRRSLIAISRALAGKPTGASGL